MHKMPFFAKLFWGLRLGLAVPILPVLPLLPVLPARSFGPARRFGLVLRGLLGIAVLAASFAPSFTRFRLFPRLRLRQPLPPIRAGKYITMCHFRDIVPTLAAIHLAWALLVAAMLP